MKVFKIRIEETLSYELEIKANSREEADLKATRMYQEEEIVLDHSNHEDTTILVL